MAFSQRSHGNHRNPHAVTPGEGFVFFCDLLALSGGRVRKEWNRPLPFPGTPQCPTLARPSSPLFRFPKAQVWFRIPTPLPPPYSHRDPPLGSPFAPGNEFPPPPLHPPAAPSAAPPRATNPPAPLSCKPNSSRPQSVVHQSRKTVSSVAGPARSREASATPWPGLRSPDWGRQPPAPPCSPCAGMCCSGR